ncbi:MAG: HAMP domain-containing histidine kinase [Clostridia bacterium]|nr:HAMP domain-containing histidine kinase [Clostridia bacterium]
MARPYRFRTLISLFVVVTMLCSSFLTVFSFSILRALRVLPNAFFATVWMPVIVVFAVNVVTGIVQWFLVPTILRPIEDLIRATDQVARGDFKTRVDPVGMVGEVRELVDSFNVMAKELGSTEIFRSDFIRDFSHEFKTPIVSMKGFAKQLKNPDLSDAEREEYCDIIIAESDRLAKMSGEILLLSKLESQEIVTDKKPYRLDEQLRNCVLLFEKEWEEKELELEVDLKDITLCQNEDLLHHVWTNLISNAVKFTPEKGRIELHATENAEYVVVTVRDSGIGMTEDELKHAFDKCYQADPSHSGKGNGLGLCITKRICTICGGSITVRSTPSKGSVFTVFLPK